MKSSLSINTLAVCLLVGVLQSQPQDAQGQIKNLGIKTRQPPPQQVGENLVWQQQQHNYTQQQQEDHRSEFGRSQYDYNNLNYNSSKNQTQHQYHHGNSNMNYNNNNNLNHNNDNSHQYENFKPAELYPFPSANYDRVPATRGPAVLDATAEFINKTRTNMPTGVCFKEVPTSSLHHRPGQTPAGNGTTPDMSRVQVCCPGYDRNPHVFNRCDPICEDDCQNGICTAPNTCVCVPGHVRSDEEKCISTCPLGCGNGVCNENNECVCKPGFKLETDTGKFCIPHCDLDCGGGGRCVAPNRCECKRGFRLVGVGVCELDCGDCENGRCTAPGVCQCKSGYDKVDGVCRPVCSSPCIKGTCVGPNTCACDYGYVLDDTGYKCVPHCDPPCVNGVCNGPRTCTCYAGYVTDDLQSNVCKPHCPQGCPNGYCTQPNLCVCQPGFIKSGIKGRTQCVAT